MPEKQLDFFCTELERYYSQNQFREKKLREKLRWRIRIELEHVVQKTSQQIAKTIQNSKHFKKKSTKYSCWQEDIGLQKTCHLCFARSAERKHCKIFPKKLFWHESLHWKLRKQFWKNQLKKISSNSERTTCSDEFF